MKKIVSSVLIFMAILYLMPIITVGITEQQQGNILYFDNLNEEITPSNEEGSEIEDIIGYDERTTVTVKINGNPREMTVREYLIGVVAAEMPAAFPIEALKAQVVAARSYMLYKIENNKNDSLHADVQLCDDYSHCTAFCDIEAQADSIWGKDANMYTEKIITAVESTDGIVAVSDGKVIAAVFHSAAATYTESAVNVWGKDFSYLVSVPSSGGTASPNYYGLLKISGAEFSKKVKNYYPKATFGADVSRWFENIIRNKSGNVNSLKVGGIQMSGSELRKILGLNSTNFTIEFEDNTIIFNTVGTGHGVGMSQYGARDMALNGAFFDEIICHYYSGVQLMVKN